MLGYMHVQLIDFKKRQYYI